MVVLVRIALHQSFREAAFVAPQQARLAITRK